MASFHHGLFVSGVVMMMCTLSKFLRNIQHRYGDDNRAENAYSA
jgi:hypothetical protein